MKERLSKIQADLRNYWSSRTKKQKIAYIASAASVILVAALLTFFLSRTEYAPLYKDVSRGEIGRIKEELDLRGIPNQVAPGGTSILVPKERVDELLVTLAAEGFPDSGTIDYSIFSQNAGFGTTDNEFNMMKLAATQTELANLIKTIDGVRDAKVMITQPTQSVFVGESTNNTTAAIILKTDAGYQFGEQQITALYNLVSKSIPNLSTDDIVIMNQHFEYFDLKSEQNSYGGSITDQMAVKKSIEKDLQRQVQMMLGTMMGQDKVVASVTTDIDFKIENREENLVTPVDEENMEGISLSVQRITETFTGNGPIAGGAPEGEDPTDNFSQFTSGTFGNGDYERVEEMVNNEVNRIRKEIVESPYKIRDIGIQVMVEPPVSDDVTSMAPGVQEDIERILETIIRTSIDKDAVGPLSDEEIAEKIVVSVQPFHGKVTDFGEEKKSIPWWVYVVGGALLLIIIVVVFLIGRSRRKERELQEELILEEQQALQVEDINEEQETEASVRRKQLEKMAKEKPEEFAKLLRTWIAED